MIIDHPDRFRGCIVGGAAADALALPLDVAVAPDGTGPFATQDMDDEAEPVRDFLPALERGFRAGQWGAATQIARLTLESLLRQGRLDAEDVARSLKLVPPEACRSWDAATRKACQALADGSSANRAGTHGDASNSALSRAVPLGLLWSLRSTPPDAFYDLRALVRITHHDSRAVAAAYVVARAVSHLVSAVVVDPQAFLADVVSNARFAEQKAMPHDEPLTARLEALSERLAMSPLEMAGCHGNSRDVIESLPFVLYVFLRHPYDYETAAVEAANAGGAAAANAQLVGSLCGALGGFHAVPTRWRMRLEDAETLAALADRLHAASAREET